MIITNVFAIAKAVKNQDWDEKDLDKIKKFEQTSKDYRVSVGKK